MKRTLLTLALAGCLSLPGLAKPALETVAQFYGPMPTGVTVSRTNRVFVNYPRWGDPVHFTVAEIKNGRPVPYPSAEMNRLDRQHPERCLVAVQSVVADRQDRLWALDTGSIKFAPPLAPKLVAIDLNTNKVCKIIRFPADVALPTTYLNDVRFDLSKGKAGTAYITDSSDKGPNAIIVVDLDSGKSWRCLKDHPSVKHEQKFVPKVEGQPLLVRKPKQPPAYVTWGCDGVALSPDGKTLYYCPLAGHHLYSVGTETLTEAAGAPEVHDLGTRSFGSDGLLCDSTGRLYLTDYEHRAIRVGPPGGPYQVLVQDPRIVWPDTLSLGGGYLYFTSNQLNRQKTYHQGHDLRKPPYTLYRVEVRAEPSAP